MKKDKIAISIDRPTLEMVDAMVDGLQIRSRSQAIEFLISKGIEQQYIKDAVILVRGEEAAILLKIVEGKTLLDQHLDWLAEHGVRNVYLITGVDAPLKKIEQIIDTHQIRARIITEEKSQGNIPALLLVKKELAKNFILLLGDTLNRFDLTKMILFHLKNDKIATVGLISSATPKKYSTVELEGDRIVEFRAEHSESHIIDAGIYTIFKSFTHTKRYFEKDILPALCHTNEIKGYFTHGKYIHFGER
jgi:NDP-sugar pyrophosphorylase family protein